MANIRNGNTFYVDSASDAGTAASFIDQKGIKILAVIFTASAAADAITINDYASGGGAMGALKLTLKNISATDSKVVNLNESAQISFPNGIWISAISSGATACLILGGPGT